MIEALRLSCLSLLHDIYDETQAEDIFPRLEQLISRYSGQIPVLKDTLNSERDSILITYGDQVQQPGQAHLRTLAKFFSNHLPGVVNGIHILPFFPWSSDDGFSIKDYRAVDSALGDWQDVERLGQDFHLMFDGVINHMSAQSAWFQAFLRDTPPYREYFLTVDGNADLSQVVRPRALPLLTEFNTAAGQQMVWTTFSADQVDLDYHNPDVLLEIIDILLMYAQRSARYIRLDAIAYLWKEIGTTCIHLPQTHAVVQLLRAVFEAAAPHVRIITETNVPHQDNISYFGNGTNEAHMVYNFALPPLVLHTFLTEDTSALSRWASELELPSPQTTFFNFLASHDGIGLNPARELLSPAEVDGLVQQTLDHGGLISYKQNPDGSQSPYEMNINFFDALSDPASDEPLELQIDRFMASQAIMLSLQGVPGIYFHSLFGSRGWRSGVSQTGHNRTINRQKLERSSLETELDNPASLRAQVFTRYRDLLTQRAASPAFNPSGKQKVLDVGSGIFGVQRESSDGTCKVTCLQNITPRPQSAGNYQLRPYQTLWE